MVEIYILKSVKKIDGCQSFTHVSILIELKEQQKCPVSQNVPVWWNYVNVSSLLLDDFKCFNFPMNCPQDSRIFGIMTTNVSKFARGLSRDTAWHVTCDITPGWQVLLCPGCGACVHNQVPLSPAQPQVARQNILWEQGSLERGDLTVGVLIKLNSIWLQLSEILKGDGILYLWCPKETSLKRNYHFCLFQHEIILFSLTFAVCQQSKSVNFMMRKYIFTILTPLD